MNSSGTSRASSVQLPEVSDPINTMAASPKLMTSQRQPDGTSSPPIESIDLTEIVSGNQPLIDRGASQADISQNVEIPETQQSVAPLLSAPQDKETKSRPRKRKGSSARDNEGMEHPKRNKV